MQYAKPESGVPPAYFPKHKTSNEEWARYLNSVSNMDSRVGIVLAELKKEKLLDDTIIIVFGDNGRGDHRSIHRVYDTGLHVPACRNTIDVETGRRIPHQRAGLFQLLQVAGGCVVDLVRIGIRSRRQINLRPRHMKETERLSPRLRAGCVRVHHVIGGRGNFVRAAGRRPHT